MGREVDNQVGTLRRRQRQARYHDRGGQQSLVGADLVDFDVIVKRQTEHASVRGIENAEAILARLHFEIRKDLAVDQRHFARDLRDPRVLGIGGSRIVELAIDVKMAIEEQLGISVRLTIHHKTDFRNYKVSIEKAENTLSFHPNHDVKGIVKNLIDSMDRFQDWDNPHYYNIETLKLLTEKSQYLRTLQEVA